MSLSLGAEGSSLDNISALDFCAVLVGTDFPGEGRARHKARQRDNIETAGFLRAAALKSVFCLLFTA